MATAQIRNHGFHLRVAEAMGLVGLAAAAFKWPPLLFPVIPLILYLILRKLGIRLRWWAWAIIILLSLAAYPLGGGPILKGNMWLAENRYTTPGRLPTLELYRPLFRAVKGTPFDQPLRNYTEWWLGPFTWQL
jgi:hypothetical protein